MTDYFGPEHGPYHVLNFSDQWQLPQVPSRKGLVQLMDLLTQKLKGSKMPDKSEDLFRLIGKVTVVLEKTGYHFWSIYPSEVEGEDRAVIKVIAGYVTECGGRMPAATYFHVETPWEEILRRLDAMRICFQETIRLNQVRIALSPRRDAGAVWTDISEWVEVNIHSDEHAQSPEYLEMNTSFCGHRMCLKIDKGYQHRSEAYLRKRWNQVIGKVINERNDRLSDFGELHTME